ncbi:Rdx family protein [Fulvimonas sp. R45]|uniref:Rdx family protein n=1 Tax=Fulvimonas sp. R45 TaxID=3045937 RepID=UPI00265EDA61|nr:Rdx family protein [Fulvimonas sp. R45]MDO1527534.1 Rdx family protein [Fulvimonas sp. R45]
MNVEIEYCLPCGYRKRADAAAAALGQQLGVSARLVPGKGGVFRVSVNGKEAISRARGYFPSPEDIVAAVRNQRADDGLQ